MDYACRLLTSSIGKKIQVALAGIFLCVFLIAHLAGNLLLWAGPEAFNHYAEALEHNPLLPVAEIGLLALFVVHILVALRVRYQNKMARPIGYENSAWAGGRTVGSASMLWTGLIVLVFVIVHVDTMRFAEKGEDLYRFVLERFQSAPYALFYIVAMLALGLHLSHGARAAARTIGIEHPKLTPVIETAGLAFAGIVSAGFAAIVVWAGWLSGGVR